MKFKIIVLMFAVLVSCGKSSKQSDANGSVADVDSNEVNNIIAYNNTMVEYMNSSGDKIDNVANDYQKMNEMVVNKRKPRMLFLGHAFIGISPNLDGGYGKMSLLNPKGDLPDAIKNDLVNSVKATSESFEKVKSAYENFQKYYKNEDFKDDDWAKGGELVKLIKQEVTNFYENKDKSYKILKPISDAAEIQMLENHPLKESIMAAKMDMNLAEEIVNTVFAKNIDMNVLSAKYDELEANLKSHKDITPDLLEKHNKLSYYKSFYEEIEDFLGEVRKSKRDGKITESEASSINSDYESIISRYNIFV